MTERLVVVGGDAAGMSAATNARRRRGPDALEIVAFERGNFTSYSACGIPYFVGGVVRELDSLIARTPKEFEEQSSIQVHTRSEVIEIDTDKGAVKVRSVDDRVETWEAFDQVVVATGAIPTRPSLAGSDANGVFGVQVLGDGTAIRDAVDRRSPRCAVVVGGGYIGLEMAESFKQLGMNVAVVEMESQPMCSVDPDMGAPITDAMRELGIEVYLEEPVEGFEVEDDWVCAVVTADRRLPADVVVLGLGSEPNTELATAAGIPVGPSGGIAVDRRMRTGVERVWAAGDCAEKWHRVARKPVAVPLGTHANKEGRIAGINIGGGYATFPGILGTAVTKICGVEVARTGLTEPEATEAGYDHSSVVVDSTTRAGYYPDAAPIKTKLIVEKRSGLLLGAQIVGRENAAKRIDALATALWNEMAVDEMLGLDLAYAPPFSPVWDPILIAARKAWTKVEETLRDCR